MKKRKIGFWRWLWQLIKRTPSFVHVSIKFISHPLVEAYIGICSSVYIFVFGIQIPIILLSFPFAILLALHGFYREVVEIEDK